MDLRILSRKILNRFSPEFEAIAEFDAIGPVRLRLGDCDENVVQRIRSAGTYKLYGRVRVGAGNASDDTGTP